MTVILEFPVLVDHKNVRALKSSRLMINRQSVVNPNRRRFAATGPGMRSASRCDCPRDAAMKSGIGR